MFNLIRRLAHYTYFGFIVFLIDLALLYFFLDALVLHYLIAVTLAFIIATTIQFLLLRRFLFNKHHRRPADAYRTFVIMSVLALVIINTLMYLAIDVYELNEYLSRIIIAATVGLCNFFIHKNISFGEKDGN